MINSHKVLLDGYNYFKDGNYFKAQARAYEVLNEKYNIDAIILAGQSAFKLNNFETAIYYLSKANREVPKNLTIKVFYFEALLNDNQTIRLIKEFEKLKIKNNTLIKIAIKAYEVDGQFTRALNLVESQSDNLSKFENLAWLYEKLNRVKKSKIYVNKGLNINPDNFKCLIVKSKIFIREKKYKKSKKTLKIIRVNANTKINQSIYYSQLAQTFEKQKKFNKAFKTYTKSNNFLKQAVAYKNLTGKSFYTFEVLNRINRYFKNNPVFDILIPCKQKVVFMVGFPRSGTTLLENILNSHTQISTVEEKPLVNDILDFFLDSPDSIKKLTSITKEEIIDLQNKYIEKRKDFCSKENEIIIDKLPLNIIHIGILYRIFPNAEFIISTRDIRDVALSCYFQNFAINDAMAYFLDWKLTKEYLFKIKNMGLSIVNNYPINNIIIKYEELVKNPFTLIRNIVDKLELNWEEDVLKYRKNIVGKNINTPSYSKVLKRINNKQVNKWQNFKALNYENPEL